MSKKIRDNLIRGGLAAGIVLGGLAEDTLKAAAETGEMVLGTEAALAGRNTVTIPAAEQPAAAGLTRLSAGMLSPEAVTDAVSEAASQAVREAASETPAGGRAWTQVKAAAAKAGPTVPADDELDEEDRITDEDLMDDELDMAGGGFSRLALASTRPFGIKRSMIPKKGWGPSDPPYIEPGVPNESLSLSLSISEYRSESVSQSLSQSQYVNSVVEWMQSDRDRELVDSSEAADAAMDQQRLVQYIKEHFSGGWVAKYETVTYVKNWGTYEASVVYHEYKTDIFEGMELKPELKPGDDQTYYLLYADKTGDQWSYNPDNDPDPHHSMKHRYAYIWTQVRDVAKLVSKYTPEFLLENNIWPLNYNKTGLSQYNPMIQQDVIIEAGGWLATDDHGFEDENGDKITKVTDGTYAEDGTPAAVAIAQWKADGLDDDEIAAKMQTELGWQFILVDLNWAKYRDDNDGYLHNLNDIQYDPRFVVNREGSEIYHYVATQDDYDNIKDKAENHTTPSVRDWCRERLKKTHLFDKNDAPGVIWSDVRSEADIDPVIMSMEDFVSLSLSDLGSERNLEIEQFLDKYRWAQQGPAGKTDFITGATAAGNEVQETESESTSLPELESETMSMSDSAS